MYNLDRCDAWGAFPQMIFIWTISNSISLLIVISLRVHIRSHFREDYSFVYSLPQPR